MATANRGQYPDIFDTRQIEFFTTMLKQDPPYYPQYFNVKKAAGQHVDSARFSGLGAVRVKAEGGPIHFDAPVQGQRRRTSHQTYALGYRVTVEAIDDARYDLLDRQPQDLGRSLRENKENLAAALLDDSFDGTIHTGLDLLSLISTAHTFLNHPGGSAVTASNELSPGVPFGVEGLEAALTNLMLTESEEGRQMGFTLKAGQVIHHPSLMHLVATTLKSEFRPGGNFNDVNVVNTTMTGVTGLTLPHLSDADSWWLAAKPSQMGEEYPLRWNQRQDVKWNEMYMDPHTLDRLYSAMERYSLEVLGWRGFVGSQV